MEAWPEDCRGEEPDYWDAATTKLDEIHFYPIELETTQENAFRGGQLHNIYNLHIDKIATYKKEHPDELRIKPHLASYFLPVQRHEETV